VRGDAVLALRPSGFSQRTCLPARVAAIVGSAWTAFGPPFTKKPIRSSATCSRQSVVASAQPQRARASSRAATLRPEMETKGRRARVRLAHEA
jgi:hypothetical protein